MSDTSNHFTFNKIETREQFTEFITWSEPILLAAIAATLANAQTVTEYVSILASSYERLLPTLDDRVLTDLTETELRFFLTARVVEIVSKVCPQWSALQVAKAIGSTVAKEDRDKIVVFRQQHINSCASCANAYAVCLSVDDPTSLDTDLIIGSEAWQAMRASLVKQFSDQYNVKPEHKLATKPYKVSIALTLGLAVIFSVIGGLSSYLFLRVFSKYNNKTNIFTSMLAPNVDPYQEVDKFINQYLESGNSAYLDQGAELARKIQEQKADKYPIDLVNFYRSSTAKRLSLRDCRKRINLLSSTSLGNNYQASLLKAEELEQDLLLLGDQIEIFKVKLFIAKIYYLSLNHEAFNGVIINGLACADKNQYLFLRLNFLLWSATEDSKITDSWKIETEFEEVARLALFLGVKDIWFSANKALAAIYNIDNEDEKALASAKALLAQNPTDPRLKITLLHICGISTSKLKIADLPQKYLNHAVEISKTLDDPLYMSTSYMFLAMINAENQQFDISQDFFQKALRSADYINEPRAKNDLLRKICGYQAKTEFIKGNYTQAIRLYQKTLDIIHELGITSNLDLAQLNQGLSLALNRAGRRDAESYRAVADYYIEKAEAKNEKNNCLLSFLPSQCR